MKTPAERAGHIVPLARDAVSGSDRDWPVGIRMLFFRTAVADANLEEHVMKGLCGSLSLLTIAVAIVARAASPESGHQLRAFLPPRASLYRRSRPQTYCRGPSTGSGKV